MFVGAALLCIVSLHAATQRVMVTLLLRIVSWRVAARRVLCCGMAWRGVVPGVLVVSLLRIMS